ncbi:SAM-dependent methyltransferase [Kitasatospora sp. MAP12-15]|uniref:class I SAM-dependent methyltransferase n=1 Tax=unclassified Kitasatospora TaxID=2633591 RepID=UPI002476979C|nr:class I SAM-dependent methyltransferase [Kitasatospora sp. MAP12-44]MDH6114188.1 SAM-dependent methyltransferase [Kitasatospora sp. MAP12-44]
MTQPAGTACFYCRAINTAQDDYPLRTAAFDLGSPAPRCHLHWRYTCALCRQARHFMATAYCPATRRFYCSTCAIGTETVEEPFAAWQYYFRYRSPWTGKAQPSLERLEFEHRHPVTGQAAVPALAISSKPFIPRTLPADQHRAEGLDDTAIAALWDTNTKPWDAGFDADGDEHRKYVTDHALLAPLGDLAGAEVLDLGCGNGYLARKLAQAGADVTGVEISRRMLEAAMRHEQAQPLGITYLAASATDLNALADRSFDAIVCNHLLTSVPDLDAALSEAGRVLRDGGRMAVALSHPCFSCGPRHWHRPAPDSPRPEEAASYAVDDYFGAGPYLLTAWEGFAPIPYVHRPLSTYWHAFTTAGLTVTGFDEPRVNSRGHAELPAWRIRQVERIPYSCLFHLIRAARPARTAA